MGLDFMKYPHIPRLMIRRQTDVLLRKVCGVRIEVAFLYRDGARPATCLIQSMVLLSMLYHGPRPYQQGIGAATQCRSILLIGRYPLRFALILN